jgi:multiple sugar transport system permease protein
MTAPAIARPPRRARRVFTGRAVTYTVLAVGLIVWMLPFAWMLLAPSRPSPEILQRPPTWWPREFTWDNFAQWFGPLDIGRFFTNSIVVALLTVLGNLVFCSMVGYALAKMDFPVRRSCSPSCW